MAATFFKTSRAFRGWMEKNHGATDELLVGFHKVDSGRASITYHEALDEALAFGWIDGIRRRIDDFSYSIRFTPRHERSVWSNVNIKRVGELIAAGRTAPAGVAAFDKRGAKRSGVYSYENTARLSPDELGERSGASEFHSWVPTPRRERRNVPDRQAGRDLDCVAARSTSHGVTGVPACFGPSSYSLGGSAPRRFLTK